MFIDVQVSATGERELYAAADIHNMIDVRDEEGGTDTLITFRNGEQVVVNHRKETIANACQSAHNIGVVVVA